MDFNTWLDLNYQEKFKSFRYYCHKYYSSFNEDDIEDMYQDSIIKVLAKSETKIDNYDGYFWITLLNCVKGRNSKLVDYVELDESIESEIFKKDDDDNYFFFKNYGFNKLVNNSKSILNPVEHKIFINYFYNQLTHQQISKRNDLVVKD